MAANPAGKAIIALIIIALAVAWLMHWYSPDRNKMTGRTQDEKEYTYKCRAGHIFNAFGRKAPRQCTVENCKEEAYLYLIFACPKDHRIGILLKTNPDEYRFEKYSSDINWKPFNINEVMNCPECYTPGLRPAPETPG